MQGQLQREAWGAAMQRAKGERVLDDPRLLKKSIKKVCAWGLWPCSGAECCSWPGSLHRGCVHAMPGSWSRLLA